MVLGDEAVDMYFNRKDKLEARLEELFKLRDEILDRQNELYHINKILGITESKYVDMDINS